MKGRVFSIVLVTLLTYGCEGTKEVRWTEDVLLPDGRTIAVERSELLREISSWSGDAGLIERKDATLKTWGTFELQTLARWQYPLIAMVLYQDSANQQWVLVARTNDCYVWEKHGKPKPPYWEFRVNERNWWQEVPLSTTSIGLAANLISSTGVDGRQHISVKDHTPVSYRLYREVWGNPTELYCGELMRSGDSGQ